MRNIRFTNPPNLPGILRLLALALGLLILLLPAGPAYGEQAAPPPVDKKVLLLYPRSMDFPFYADFTAGFKQRLAAEASLRIDYSTENLEILAYTSDDTVARAIAAAFRQKSRDNRPDIIVVHSLNGARFLANYCGDIFGDTPVVAFNTRPVEIDPALRRPHYTYCHPELDPARNAALILDLLPAVRQLYVVMGRSESELKVLGDLPRQLAPFAGQVAITYLDGLSLPDLTARVAAIDGPAAVLFVDFARDAGGALHFPAKVVRSLAAVAKVPVFGSYTTHIGADGAVGGYVLNMGNLGKAVGEQTLALLQGRAAPGGVETVDIAEYRFDWRGLNRWAIAAARLPAGSIVVNKPPSVWQSYKMPLLGALLFAAAIIGLLVALIALHSRRRLEAERRALLHEVLLGKKEEIIRERTSELYEAEERFQRIFHNSPAMIAIYSMADDKHLEVNQKYLDVLGYTRGEVIGRTAKELRLRADHTDREAEARRHDLLIAGEIPLAEQKFRTKSGETVTALTTVTTIQIGDEQCLIAIMQDISEEKRLEADLARLDRLNLIGEMAAGIGHEVRNPMTTVRGYLQMFQLRKEFHRYKEQFATMIEELDRANTIISEFLSLAKNKVADLKPGRLNDSLAAILPLLQADALRTGHFVGLNAGQIPVIDFDEKELRQLVLNLVRNALEAMPAGGAVTIATCRDGDHVVLAVRDTGPGIPKRVIKKIGTPFLTTKENGTGLGLSVCYRIAERHRATIDFTTGKNGTTFYVRFPLAPDSAGD